MSQEFMDKVYNLLFNFKDLTQLGSPGISSGLSLVDDGTLYKISPERYNFYMHVLESINNPNSKVLEAVVKKENLTHYQRDQLTDRLNSIDNYVQGNSDNLGDKNNAETFMKELNKALGANVLTQDLKVDKKKVEGGAPTAEDIKKGLNEYLFGKTETEYPAVYFKNADKDTVIKKLNNNPYYSPVLNESLAWSDRAIFIAITYIIRSVAVFMVEWAIYSGYVTDFNNAFGLYFGIYIMIYILLLYLVNSDKDDNTFKLVFYYMNFYSTTNSGIIRNVIHILCLLILLPIPYIVREYREFNKEVVLTFQEKKKILNGIDKFSMYIWLLTSIIALKV
jgi:uncharacterized membrane-anchored protein